MLNLKNIFRLVFISTLLMACSAGVHDEFSSDERAEHITDASDLPPIKEWWHDSLIGMTHDATIVITGQVISQKTYSVRSDWLPRPIIVTTVAVKVGRTLKGVAPESVQIDVIGGCLEGTCLDKSHEATFEDGERDIFFLIERSAGKFGVIHGESGKICLDGRYIRRNSEAIEVPEDELLSVIVSAAGSEKAVRR